MVQHNRVSYLEKMVSSQSEKKITNKNREDFAKMMAEMDDNTGMKDMIDTHTKLFTEQAFHTKFYKLINQAQRYNNLFALVMIELIPSKNMTSPHQTVDSRILVEAAHRIKKSIRDMDIASYGENNIFFILFANMVKPEVIVHGVERIIDSLHHPYINKSDDQIFEANVHAAVTIYPFDGDDQTTLLTNTQAILDKIRPEKRNLFQFYQEETQALGERELALKSALKNPDFLNNVILEYRPYYDIKNKEIVCIHVVASLKHPELGVIPYDEFLRFAHYSSKLFELYEWMMQSAILKFNVSSEINTKPKRFIFSFNLKQFEIPNFLDKIIAIIKNLSSADNEIIMEIEDDEIETSNLNTFKQSIKILNQSNIPITIGILVLGHFALNKLKELQFCYLKIDKKLVKDIGKRRESVAILEQIMMLANVMQIETLTTGVDTNEQKIILENLGCIIIQGKLFDGPKKEGLFIEYTAK